MPVVTFTYLFTTTTPSEWNSVHQPINFTYNFESISLIEVQDDGGFFRFKVGLYNYTAPVAGDRVWITDGSISGYHTVTNVVTDATNTYITTSTPYTTFTIPFGVIPGVRAIVPVPLFTLYKGYQVGTGYETQLPFEEVVSFTPVPSIYGDLRIDVSGFLKSIFSITTPVSNGIDFGLFNRFKLRYAGQPLYSIGGGVDPDPYYQVLNSAIPTDELMSVYFGTGVYLSSSTTQIIFQCGKTVLSLLDTTGVVVNTEVSNGDTGADYYYPDYNSNDYLTQN